MAAEYKAAAESTYLLAKCFLSNFLTINREQIGPKTLMTVAESVAVAEEEVMAALPASPDPPQASENESEEVAAGTERRKRPRHHERPQTSWRRKRATCQGCNFQVVHLPQHLRTAQDKTKEDAKLKLMF